MKAAVFIVVVIALGAVGYWLVFDGSDNSSQSRGGATTPLVDIVVAETLSPNAQIGKTAYESKCAGCHGVNAVGQDGVAPPLVHVIYKPSHHGDEPFQRGHSRRCTRPSLAVWRHAAGRRSDSERCCNDHFLRPRATKIQRKKLSSSERQENKV